MNKIALLSKVRSIYESDSNIMEYLRQVSGNNENNTDDIMISYDFQAGTYVDAYLANKEWKDLYLSRMMNIFHNLPGRKKQFLNRALVRQQPLFHY